MRPHHVAARIAKRAERCRPNCAGYKIATPPRRDPYLIACVACNELNPDRLRVTDQHVRSLPIALELLRDARKERARELEAARVTTHNSTGLAAMCGHALGPTANGRRQHRATFATAYVTCAECLRLMALTPAQRAAESQAKSNAIRERFAGKNAAAKAAREKLLADTRAEVESRRFDAVACLDAIEEVGGNAGLLTPERSEFLYQTLAVALVAYRLDNPKSHGERLWVFEGGPSVPSIQRRATCRFCRATLIRQPDFGHNYSIETAPHTIPCALRYLAGAAALKPSSDDPADDDSPS